MAESKRQVGQGELGGRQQLKFTANKNRKKHKAHTHNTYLYCFKYNAQNGIAKKYETNEIEIIEIIIIIV